MRNPKRPRVSQVQIAGRSRRDAASVRNGGKLQSIIANREIHELLQGLEYSSKDSVYDI